jgi:DNA-binding transcriptional LysR family regulator
VGFAGSVLYRGLPAWLSEYQSRHPRIELTLRELNSQEQIEALLHEEIDVGLIHTPRVPEGLVAELVYSEPFVACVYAGHPAAHRRRIALETLRDEPFVLFSRRVSPDYYARIVAMCEAAGFTPRVRHEVRHWLSVVAMVAQGLGVAVVPAPMSRSALAGAVFKPLAAAAPPTEVYCAWRRDEDQPARAQFVRLVLGREGEALGAAPSRG